MADRDRARELLTPDPLLAIVKREAARIEHPAVRATTALRAGWGVVLTLIFQYGISTEGLDVIALIYRMGECIEREMPDYDRVKAYFPALRRDSDTRLPDGPLTWLSIIWVGGN